MAVVNGDGATPLHVASAHNHCHALSALLDAGAVVDADDNEAQTPLHVAAAAGATEAVRLLLTHGAQWTQRDKEVCTPLHRAAEVGATAAVAALLAHGLKVEGRAGAGDIGLIANTPGYFRSVLDSLDGSHCFVANRIS